MPEFTFECPADHIEGTLCGCGLRVGQMELRNGILCSVDEHGRVYYRAPRRADVQLAQRVVASIKGTPDAAARLASDITSIREK